VSIPNPPQQPGGEQWAGQPGYGAAQPGYGGAPHPGAAIALTTKFMPLAFFYFFVKPKVAVDGYPVATDWGPHGHPGSTG
jgi:hypothetical protein